MLFRSLFYFTFFVLQVYGKPRKYGTHIIGGSAAPKDQYPYQVSLQNSGDHFCGASIISENWVLTAGHCIAFPADQFVIVVGTNNLKENGTEYAIESIIVHPSFIGTFSGSDIALLKLKNQIKFTKSVQPIRLATAYPKQGDVATLTGWGTLDPEWDSTQMFPFQLQVLSVNVISWKACIQYYSKEFGYYKNFLTHSQFCTLNKYGQGACQGDSGGPLVSANKEQIGVVSFTTEKKCAVNKPYIYASVAYCREWIRNQTGV